MAGSLPDLSVKILSKLHTWLLIRRMYGIKNVQNTPKEISCSPGALHSVLFPLQKILPETLHSIIALAPYLTRLLVSVQQAFK